MRIIEIKRPMEINNCQQEEEEYLHLQQIIESKRNMLLKKQKKIQKIAKHNAFLENIKDGYLKYNNYIVKQKQDQITALQLLNNYIEHLNTSGQLTEHNIQDANMEQNKIIKELKAISQGLDKIMNESNEINDILVSREKRYHSVL